MSNKTKIEVMILCLIFLVVMPSAFAYDIEDTLNQGETKTYVRGDRQYVVAVDFVGEDFVYFTYNGQASGRLEPRDRKRFNDGTSIVVREILFQGHSGGRQQVELGIFLGAGDVVRDNETNPSNITESVNATPGQPEESPLPVEAQPPSKQTTVPAPVKKTFWARVWEFIVGLF